MLFIVSILVALVALAISIQVRRKGLSQNLRALGLSASLLQVITLVALGAAAFQTISIIQAGTVGVVKVFGKVGERPLREGVNIRNPFAEIIKMNARTQERREEMRVPSKEGLMVTLEVSVLYRLIPERAPEVYRTVGLERDYIERILIPNFRSVVRGVTSQYEAKALYTSMRDELAGTIRDELNSLTEPRGILIESTPLRQVDLPSDLAAAIEEKLRSEQESQRMEFILERERKEADRKRIEAQGIADFQKIVAEGISDQLLRWKGIEATEKLAASANTKVVVIGAGKEGLPLILGGQ